MNACSHPSRCMDTHKYLHTYINPYIHVCKEYIPPILNKEYYSLSTQLIMLYYIILGNIMALC